MVKSTRELFPMSLSRIIISVINCDEGLFISIR